MKDRLFHLLGVEPGEESMVSLLLTQSVFLGIFFGAFDISAHSFFLSVFDEKMMARGYVLSGLAGIILTSLYTFLQRKAHFRYFATANLFFVTACTVLLWVLLLVTPARWIIWLVFIMLGPLNILAMLGFWGTAGRLFTLRQGKRLFGLVDAGLVAGVIISCYAIPVLLTFNFSPHNIILLSAGAVLTATVIQILIGSRFSLANGREEVAGEPSDKKRSLLNVVRHDRYIRTIAIFIALSVMTAFFVQYSFMAVTREQYPSEDDMARFLGLFTGSMMIFTLFVKLFVFSYLIRNYGLRTCLALTPVLIAAFSVIAVVIGILKGYTPAAGLGFLLFFMLLALSRLFSKALKDSIESPSFKVIYQTIGENIRYEIQSGMDGTINEIAALTSGLILAAMGMMSFVTLIHFSFVLIFIAVIWIFFAIKLYSGYRNSIRKALEAVDEKKAESPQDSLFDRQQNLFSASLALKDDYFRLVSGDLGILKNKSREYLYGLIEKADSSKDINLIPALKNIISSNAVGSELAAMAGKTVESLELFSSGYQTGDDRFSPARRLLAGSKMPQTTQVLRLLRDNPVESRRIALYMIGKFRMTDMLPEVVQCLNISSLENEAANVIRSFGSESYEELRRFYLLSSGNVNTSRRILMLLGENCDDGNKAFLFSRLWSNSRIIRETALSYLAECGYLPDSDGKDKLHQMISDVISVMTWNLSAKITLKRQNDTFLGMELEKEIQRWNGFLFTLLSITYDRTSVTRIRENLMGGTVESVNYALEMIDMVIDDSIKPKIIPLLDVISDEEKVKHLFQFFPGEIPEYGKLIEDILNRDYNLLGIWIRACMMRNLVKTDSEYLKESVIALLFSPELILREEAALLLARKEGDLSRDILTRLPQAIRERLKKIADGSLTNGEMVYDKVRFLSSCFCDSCEEDLIFLAEALIYSEKISPGFRLPEDGSLIWNRDSKKVSLLYKNGRSVLMDEDNGEKGKFYILPLSAVEEYHRHFPEKAVNILEYIGNISQ